MPRGRALIVDDSPTARVLLSRMLERLDLSTVGAASAEDALSLLRHERPDLIFLDHMLPGMDGFEALQELKRQPHTRDIPVIMYTSQHAERYLEEALAKGAKGVIGKQIDREQLKAQLEDILQAREDHAGSIHSIPDEPTMPMVASQPAQPETPTPAVLINRTADSLITPLGEDDAPSLTETVQWRKLTGRMSVLENAWQESQDEVHRLRQELSEQQLHQQQEIEQRATRNRLLWITMLVIMITLAGGIWYQLESFSSLLTNVESQFVVMRDVLNQLMGLIAR